ncbi:MAG: uroporphyrinogen decarboxylase family protein [Dehalococcoidales bacterium]
MAIQSTVEKSYEETEKRLIGEIEKRHGKSVEELRQEREKRIRDAMELKEPDRVPVTFNSGAFASKYSGLKASAMYYDPVAYREACLKVLLDFEPDSGGAAAGTNSGLMLELLDPRHQRWPGGTLPPDVPYQFVEGEYMKEDEYDIFLNDPSDFIIRYYLPRLYGALEPLTELPPFRNLIGGMGFTSILGLFNRPEFRDLAGKISKAADEQQVWSKESAVYGATAERFGFPSQQQSGSTPGGAPFDAVSDFLRGMRGAMIDMYRCPDNLLAACDKILEWRIERSTPANPKVKGDMVRGGGAPLHRGSDGFMSIKQFEKFYWPGLKKAVLVAVDLGYTTSSFCEGIWDERLEYWLEIPKGKAILRFEKTDMFKAKEVLGGHHCIQGGVPSSLLEVGSPSEVEEYCKKLIEVCGKGGGFILGPGSSIDCAKPANIKAMIDAAHKYGQY